MLLTHVPRERPRNDQWPSWRDMVVFVLNKGWRTLRWSALALAALAFTNEDMKLIPTPLPIAPIVAALLLISFGIPLYQWLAARRRFLKRRRVHPGTISSSLD